MRTARTLLLKKCKKTTHSRLLNFGLICLAAFFLIIPIFSQTAHSTTAQVLLEWNPNTKPGLSGYKVHYGTSSGNYDTAVDVGKYASCVISGLQEGQTYYFAATAYDLAGNETVYSNEVSALVSATDTGESGGNTDTGESGGNTDTGESGGNTDIDGSGGNTDTAHSTTAQVLLEWNPNTKPGLSGYKVHYGTSSGNYDTAVDVGKYASCVISGLQEGQTYYFAATAYDLAGNETVYSNEVSALVSATDTGESGGNTDTGESGGNTDTGESGGNTDIDGSGGNTDTAHSTTAQVLLEWNPNTKPGLSGYKVHYGTSSGNYDTAVDVGKYASCVIFGLQEGQTYYFAATAYDLAGNETVYSNEVSALVSATDTGESGGNTDTGESGGNTDTGESGGNTDTGESGGNTDTAHSTTAQVLLEWNPNTKPGLSGYKVHYGTSSGNYDTAVDVGKYASCVISGLQEGQTYYFAATAYDLAGNETVYSNEVSALVSATDTGESGGNTDTGESGGNTDTGESGGNTDTGESGGDGAIRNVAVSNGNTYEAVRNGVEVGELVYVDRTYTFTEVPEYLKGAAYIKTANDDKGSTGDNFLSFDVNQNVTVYLGHDVRISGTPSWLLDFTDTGDEIVTSDTPFRLFAKDFSAGTINLGGNNDSGGGYSMYTSMYTVIIVPQTSSGSGGDGKFIGAGMRIAPHARLDDSLLDVIRWGPRFYRGSYLSQPRVNT